MPMARNRPGDAMSVYGCAVNQVDCRLLVTRLFAEGSPQALAARETISNGLSSHAASVSLTAGMRDALLRVLGGPPNSLGALQTALAMDQRARS
jgi:hypothetical protein